MRADRPERRCSTGGMGPCTRSDVPPDRVPEPTHAHHRSGTKGAAVTAKTPITSHRIPTAPPLSDTDAADRQLESHQWPVRWPREARAHTSEPLPLDHARAPRCAEQAQTTDPDG